MIHNYIQKFSQLIVGLIIYFLIEEIDSTTMWDYIR